MTPHFVCNTQPPLLLHPGNETLSCHVRKLHVEWDDVERSPATDISFLTTIATRLEFHCPMVSQSAQLTLLLHLLPDLPFLSSAMLLPADPLSHGSSNRLHRKLSLSRSNHYASSASPALAINPRGQRGPLQPHNAPSIQSIDVRGAGGWRFPKFVCEAATSRSLLYKLRGMHVNPYPTFSRLLLPAPHTLTTA